MRAGVRMTRIELTAAVRDIVRSHARIAVPEIDDRQILTRDLGFDSLAFLLTLSDLEDRFRFRFPLENVDHLREVSFGELVHLVAAQGMNGVTPASDDSPRV